MKVVVTGGAGFIGGNLCRHLSNSSAVHDVVVVDDLSSGTKENLVGLDVTLFEGSILQPDLLDEAFADAAAVVHLAAVPSVPRSLADPVRSHEVNATGTLQVLEAARRADPAPHVVVASSSSVYGANPALPKTESLRPMPMSPYAVSKLATETYALAHARCFGLDVLAFRFFNVFGPLQPAGHAYAAVVPAFVDAALAGRPLSVHGDGLQSRDFTFVDTVASVLTRSVQRRITAADPVNLAYGTRTTLTDLIEQLAELLGRDLLVEHAEPRAGDVRDSQADSRRLRSLFPDVVPTGMREGLAATVAWFESTAP